MLPQVGPRRGACLAPGCRRLLLARCIECTLPACAFPCPLLQGICIFTRFATERPPGALHDCRILASSSAFWAPGMRHLVRRCWGGWARCGWAGTPGNGGQGGVGGIIKGCLAPPVHPPQWWWLGIRPVSRTCFAALLKKGRWVAAWGEGDCGEA